MTDLSATLLPGSAAAREHYIAMIRRKRIYGAMMLALFVVLMITGFDTVAARSAGGFWEGLPRVFDFPAGVVREAWE